MSEQERRQELAAWIRSAVPPKDLGRTETGDKFLEVADLLPRPYVPETLSDRQASDLAIALFGFGDDRFVVEARHLWPRIRRILEQREGEDE